MTILHYDNLTRQPKVFEAMTGLRVREFDQLYRDVLSRYADAEEKRLSRRPRQRAIGAGRKFELSYRNRLLLVVVWLRKYPTHEVLGYLFGVSDSTVCRYIRAILPLLQATGRDTMRMPDPGRKHRRQLDDLLKDTPDLAVLIDSFEQRVQRCKDRQQADAYYSGKKKQHTLKSQVAIDETTGKIVDIAPSVCGSTADVTLLKQSGVLERLPEGVGALGDLGYLGIKELLPPGFGATPRKKPRSKPRPPEDQLYNRAFSRRRVRVENTIGRMRWYEAITHMDRNHRLYHTERVCAVAGLVNRQIDNRRPYTC